MPPIQNSSPSHNNNAAQADEHQDNPNPHERKRGTPPRKHRNSSTNQIVQMFKTDFILANVAFFVKVISGKKCCCYRSAGACPPRSLKQNEKRPQPKMPWTFSVQTEAWRGKPARLRVWQARAQALRFAARFSTFHRSAGACPPRSLRRNEKHPQPGGHGRFLFRPMHGEGQALALRFGSTVWIATKEKAY